MGDNFESSTREPAQQPPKEGKGNANVPGAKSKSQGTKNKQVFKPCNHGEDASILFRQSTKGKTYGSLFKDTKGIPYDCLTWHKASTGQQQVRPQKVPSSSTNKPAGTKRSYKESTGPREGSDSNERSDKRYEC